MVSLCKIFLCDVSNAVYEKIMSIEMHNKSTVLCNAERIKVQIMWLTQFFAFHKGGFDKESILITLNYKSDYE